MLSKKERVWLERRKNPCVHCVHYGLDCDKDGTLPGNVCAWLELDVGDPDYKDAAEFEARVALWLVHNGRLFEEPCSYQRKCKCPHLPFKRGYCNRWCKLMTARLAVEREMEKL